MASITDCVSEGLKYPFKDIKKLLCFGVLFAILDLLLMGTALKFSNITRVAINIAENATSPVSVNFSQLPSGDVYAAIALLIIGFIVFLFIMGYQYNIIKFSIDKKQDLPGFSDIANIFVRGIKYFLVSLAYNIIPVLIMIVGSIFLANTPYLAVVIIISVILSIIIYFLQIMALNNMIAYDSIRKAFDLNEIIDNIANLGWVKYIGIIIFTILVLVIIMTVCGFILSVLTAVLSLAIHDAFWITTIVSMIQGLLVVSYGNMFYSRVCGSIYREAIK